MRHSNLRAMRDQRPKQFDVKLPKHSLIEEVNPSEPVKLKVNVIYMIHLGGIKEVKDQDGAQRVQHGGTAGR